MTDIFISYSRNDRERVRVMAQALEAEGFDVWWDPEILPGESFSNVIDKKLKDASCIIAVWSATSINSNWVQEEADDGMMRNTLIPVMIDEIELPRGFKRLQTADLQSWKGNINDPNWKMILTQVHKLVSNRAALEAAERQAAAQAQAKTEPRTEHAAAAQASIAPSEKKRNGFLLPLAIGAFALIGAGVSGFLLMSRGGEDKPASIIASNDSADTHAPPTVEAPEQAVEIAPLQEPATPDQNTLGLATSGTNEVLTEVAEDVADNGADALPSDPVVEQALPDDGTAPANEPPSFTPGQTFSDCEHCPQMMPLQAGGTFTMGAPDDEYGRDEVETPQVTVTIAKPFAIGVHEVTHDDWAACLADGGCGGYEPSDLGWGRGRLPLVNVSSDDARQYLAWLSEKTGANYRLPSEAEWEHAARAGKADAFHTGDLISTDQANFNGEYPYKNAQKGQYRSKTTTVGAFTANAFGLHDMHGNVWEWTEDCWRNSHSGAPVDGSSVGGSCASHVLKGGAWNSGAWRLRSAYRKAGANKQRKYDTGFRVARDL